MGPAGNGHTLGADWAVVGFESVARTTYAYARNLPYICVRTYARTRHNRCRKREKIYEDSCVLMR